ncbi:TetR/AcrR family transcriptional regulator [Conexibacter sp. CPCC 206217]|uniref:TetR/AcrR family transcriptional regulator n=1 Tax=Conexibacter sp. CPCC 206217 TaxID=3064574 RepID=UPI0027266213|nr:TetR family transcriptional regulator [Conexibacter sp. CPCC 206217]MDO8211124.1 TetR family transcriptional regulator [Conexibacter sp. CPCC 206217]
MQDDESQLKTSLSREEILAESVGAFSRNGYRGTNLQDVAEVLGVTRQAIYYHFRNKHAILLALFESFFDRLGEGVYEARAAQPDPALQFEAMLRAHIVTVARHPEMSSVFTREFESLVPDERSKIQQRRRLYQGMFSESLAAAQAAGRVRRDLPVGPTMSLLFGAANWTFRWFREDRGEMSAEQLAEMMMDLFRSGFGADEAPAARGNGRRAARVGKKR